jgi:methionyl aminopeptidase
MARAGTVARQALNTAADALRAGITTQALDDAARAVMLSAGAEPVFSGYVQGASPPFPASTCISVNEEVVHGIPGARVLLPGDLVTIDVGVRLDGWCADSAVSVVVPLLPEHATNEMARRRAESAARLVEATRALLQYAIQLMQPGVMWSQIARALELAADQSGFGIVTEYIGHGIGRKLHESPRVPAYWTGFQGEDFRLEEGMTLAVEPMLTSRRGSGLGIGGSPTVGTDGLPAWRTRIRDLGDGWTVVTRDGSLACHEEHVVAVVAGGTRILTADSHESHVAEIAPTGRQGGRRL